MRDLKIENSYIMGIRWSWVKPHFPHRLMIATKNIDGRVYSHVYSHFNQFVGTNNIDVLYYDPETKQPLFLFMGMNKKLNEELHFGQTKNLYRLHRIRKLFFDWSNKDLFNWLNNSSINMNKKTWEICNKNIEEYEYL